MADSSVPITAGTGTNVDTFTQADGNHRQAMVLGDASAAYTAAVDALGRLATALPDTAATGTLAANNANVGILTAGRGVTAVELTGTWVGTVSFYGTADPSGLSAGSSSWTLVNAPAPTQPVTNSSTTVNGIYRINSSGYTAVRVVMTPYTSGTATVWLNASGTSSVVTLAEPATIGGLYYPQSLSNNTTAQLASAAAFTGGVETVLSLQAAQVEIVCDQPYRLDVYQYIDAAGAFPVSVDTFFRTAGVTLNENLTLPGNYFNLKVTNLGTSTTTTLRVDCTFGIMNTLPRALSNLGNLKNAVTEVGGYTANARPDGYLSTRADAITLLSDTFETIDTTNTWTVAGTAVPTGAAGVLTVSPGTTALATSYARSQPTFQPMSPSYLQGTVIATLDAAAKTGNKRIFGFGVPAGSPTVSAPLANGVVFEYQDSDGSLIGAVYSNSVRTQTVALVRVTDGVVARPTDGGPHRYGITYKTSRVYFDIDNVMVGMIPFPNTQVAALPMVIMSVNGASTVSPAATLTATVMSTADSGTNEIQISDGTYPWRKAKIDTTGAINVNIGSTGGSISQASGTLSAVGSNTPGSASTTSTTGQIVASVAAAGNLTFHLVTSAFVGTVIFEGSVDAGLNYSPIACVREDGTGSESSSTVSTATAFIRQYTSGLPGMTYFRVRASAFTSGTMAVLIAPGPFLIEPSPSLAASTASIGRTGPQTATTGAVTSVAPAATSAQVLAANSVRMSYKLFNDSNVDALVSESTTAVSTTAYSVRVPAGGYYEGGGTNTCWAGIVTCLGVVGTTATAATSGALRVTEWSP